MNPKAQHILADGMLKGGFDVLDALLSLSFQFEREDAEEAETDVIRTAIEAAPVCIRSIVRGGGAIAQLFSMEDATKIASLTMSGVATPADSLDDDQTATFQEIGQSMLGGGVSNLSTLFAQDVELEKVEVVVLSADDSASLIDFAGRGAAMIPFKFVAEPDFEGRGVLVMSAELEKRVPATLLDQSATSAPLVSEAEMKDILSGFTPEEIEGPSPLPPGPQPRNMGVVLDIGLVATARLGRVEMPISKILGLGPGSIIEMAQLVDEPIDLLVNDRLVARGDVVVVDEKFGIRITEIISKTERIENLR